MKGEQRLMGANEAAKYLGLSYWTLRELIWSGAIPLVQLPNKNGGRLRRILVAKNDLDRLIEQSKETGDASLFKRDDLPYSSFLRYVRVEDLWKFFHQF